MVLEDLRAAKQLNPHRDREWQATPATTVWAGEPGLAYPGMPKPGVQGSVEREQDQDGSHGAAILLVTPGQGRQRARPEGQLSNAYSEVTYH